MTTLLASKATPLTVTNSVAVVSDPELTLSIESGTYLLRTFLAYTSTKGADVRFGFALPASATLYGCVNSPNLAAASAGSQNQNRLPLVGTMLWGSGGIGSGAVQAAPFGLLVAPNSGSVTVRFAQNVVESTSTATLLAGSYLMLTKIS